MMKRLFALLLAGLCLFSAVACQNNAQEEKLGFLSVNGGQVYPDPFLTFNGQTVSFEEFRYYYLNYRDMYLEQNADYFSGEGTEESLKNEVLQCLLDSWAVRFLAEEYGVSLSQEESAQVASDIDSTIDFYGGEAGFVSKLHDSYMSLPLYQTMMEYSSLYLKVFDKTFEEGSEYAWTNEKFYAYYQENYVAVQEIFIAYKEGEEKTSCPQTELAIRAVYDKAVAGEDFWSLIEQYGEDENMEANQNGYYFTKGQAEDALFEASKNLKINELSAPVSGEAGLYILKRLPMTTEQMDANRDTTLKGYTDSLGTFHSGVYDDVFADIYKKKAEEIQITYSEYWDKISTKTVN